MSFSAPGNSDIEQARKEFALINQAYLKMDKYRMKVEYRVYADYATQVAEEQSKGYVIRSGTNYLSDMLGIRTLQNNTYRIMADTLNKILVVAHPQKLVQDTSPAELVTEVLGRCSSVSITKGEKISECRLVLPEGSEDFSQIRLQYDKNYLVKKLILFHLPLQSAKGQSGPAPRTEISYTQVEKNPALAADLFSEKNFVIIVKGMPLRPAPRFAGYKLIDQLN